MRRLPVAAFVALAIATIAAFFVTQHLKVTTPVVNGFPAPAPAAINPINGRTCAVHQHDGTVKLVNHRRMFVSFYLQNRSDNVDVYIVNQDGNIVRTIGSDVYMQARPPKRHRFVWDGRTDNGSVAPDGTYYIKVSLIHQGRSVLISNPAGAEPVTVVTVPPHPRITSVRPKLIPQKGVSGATIHYTGANGLPGRILVYRTDPPGPPRLVKNFAAGRNGTSVWDGTLPGGRPAPQGTYIFRLEVTDKACNIGYFPPEWPPVPGTTAHDGVTVRYLAAQTPTAAVPAGTAATVYVDARQHAYHWALLRPGSRHTLASGTTRDFQLQVPLPGAGPGVYELALRSGDHRTAAPLVASKAPRASRARVLVILPALTWQGYNPVDDDGDGLPNTLAAGDSISLERPYADGLPANFAGEAALLAYLKKAGFSYDVTTDLGLERGIAPSLNARTGVVLAGTEMWVPAALGADWRGYVAGGGHLLSLGVDSLRRGVTVSGQSAFLPTRQRAVDMLGARVGPVTKTHGTLILAGADGLGIFSGTSGALSGYRTFEPFHSLTAPERIASEAGVSAGAAAVIGYRLGRGSVIDVGLPGFASTLAHNFDGRQLLDRIWHHELAR